MSLGVTSIYPRLRVGLLVVLRKIVETMLAQAYEMVIWRKKEYAGIVSRNVSKDGPQRHG